MSGPMDPERILGDFLGPDSDRLADRVIDAALADIARIQQRPAVRVPWRFPRMPALARPAGIAAMALVAVVAVGGLVYINASRTGGAGGPPAASPTPAPTPAPTPSLVTPGITGWLTYPSRVYGIDISYPKDWSIHTPAVRKFRTGDLPGVDLSSEIFTNPESVDGDEIALWVGQLPAPSGANLDSWEGLRAAYLEMCAKPAEFGYVVCPTDDRSVPMCVGDQACRPAIIVTVSNERTPSALIGDPATGVVTLFSIGRPDDFPAAARYGGSVQLLKSIVSQADVRDPRPGETPH